MSGTVTINAEAWALHQRAMKLLNQMADDPKKGIDFKRMAKSIDPSLLFSDLDTAERVHEPTLAKLTAAEERIAKMEAERETEKMERQQAEAARSLTGDIDGAVKLYGLTLEGREKMTKRMQEKGSLDAESAAAWVASQAPKPKPSEGAGQFSPAAMNLYGSAVKDDQYEGLHRDPVRWMDETVVAILNEDPQAA
jgi:hypothetical protein